MPADGCLVGHIRCRRTCHEKCNFHFRPDRRNLGAHSSGGAGAGTFRRGDDVRQRGRLSCVARLESRTGAAQILGDVVRRLPAGDACLH